jgi:hypothetical protein
MRVVKLVHYLRNVNSLGILQKATMTGGQTRDRRAIAGFRRTFRFAIEPAAASQISRPCSSGRCVFSRIHPNVAGPTSYTNQLGTKTDRQPIAGFWPTFRFAIKPAAASWSSRPCSFGRCVFSCIHPNVPAHGPPTSSVRPGQPQGCFADHRRPLPTRLETRPHPAMSASCCIERGSFVNCSRL